MQWRQSGSHRSRFQLMAVGVVQLLHQVAGNKPDFDSLRGLPQVRVRVQEVVIVAAAAAAAVGGGGAEGVVRTSPRPPQDLWES